MTKAKEAAKEKEKQEAIEYLKTIIKPHSTVYVNVNKVSSSGMTRHMTLVIPKQTDQGLQIQNITWYVAQALDWKFDRKDNDLVVGAGCGMDMCFHTVYMLARRMFRTEENMADAGYLLEYKSL